MNKQEIKKFADAFAARRHELPRTFLALGNTVAAALRLWENRRPQVVPGAVELAADPEPERMPYTVAPNCSPWCDVPVCVGVMLSEKEAEHLATQKFHVYPER